MRPKRKTSLQSSQDDTRPPFASPLDHKVQRAFSLDPRELWWNFVDAWEGRPALRRALLTCCALLVLFGIAWFWGYPRWTRHNAYRMAQQWIDAGRVRNAAEVVHEILATDAKNPEAWRLAAALARLRGHQPAAAGYSRRAADLAPERPDLAIELAADTLLVGRPEEAEKILSDLPPQNRAGSAQAQRVLGEIARRRFQLSAARDHFTSAIRLGGALPANELPLGLVLLNSTDPAERLRGAALLEKWTDDPVWGADAMRPLLSDALARDDRAVLRRWAEKLREHPRCTLGDVPNCLLALDRADPDRFATVLAGLKRTQAASSTQAALLLDWLNQIGRPVDAVRWAQTLPAKLATRAPVLVPVAESMRRAGDWSALESWIAAGDWTVDLELIRLAYAFEASRNLGLGSRQSEIWRTLQSAAVTNGARAFFTANLLYAWGRTEESLELLWIAAEQTGVAVEALGTLARHYQVQQDARGQYRVFRQLHSIRPADRDLANNYVFFAALLGLDLNKVRQLAEQNLADSPQNAVYRATAAFVLLTEERGRESLALLGPISATWRQSPAVAFAYGLALASQGQKTEARPILASLDPKTLTRHEVELIKRSLD